jgi:hypothetical protein
MFKKLDRHAVAPHGVYVIDKGEIIIPLVKVDEDVELPSTIIKIIPRQWIHMTAHEI